MVVCRFFAQGYCRYGNNCRFEHIRTADVTNRYVVNNTRPQGYNQTPPPPNKQFTTNPPGGQISFTDKEIQQSVNQDMDDWIIGKLWPFSVYAPFKECDNFPTFEDASPEELRWNAYNAKIMGTSDNYILEIKKLERDIHEKRLALKKPNKEVLEVLRKIFRREKLNVSTPTSFALPTAKAQETPNAASTFKFQLPLNAANSQNSTPFSNQNFQNNALPSLFSQNGFGAFNNQSPSMFGGSTQEESIMQMATPVSMQNSAQFQNSNQPKTGFSFAMEDHPSLIGSTPKSTIFTQPSTNNSSLFGNGSATHLEINNNSTFKSNSGFSFTLPNQSINNKVDDNTYSLLSELIDEERQEFEAKQFTLGKIPDIPPPKEVVI